MNSLKNPLLALSLLAFVVGLSISVISEPEYNSGTSAIYADYPVYSDIYQLMESSDLVVRGSVKERLTSRRLTVPNINRETLPPQKAATLGPVVTDTLVVVSEVLFGSEKWQGKALTIAEVGGALNGREYLDASQPLSTPGEDYLFFLEGHSDGTFSILGGAQGRFRIRDNALESVSQGREKSLPVPQDLDGLTLTELRQELASI